MLDSVQRFSRRAENYLKYRPHYPPEIMQILQKECGLLPRWRIADIGSGTGFLAELFLKNGNATIGVEPNKEMREAGEKYLSAYPSFISVDGTAEATTLEGSCVDMVVAGQAFHWFDRAKARSEFQRILKPNGWIVLVWNERRIGGTPFLEALQHLREKHCPEYEQVTHRRVDKDILTAFFSPAEYRAYSCPNRQPNDLASLKGGFLSASYAPETGEPGHEEMMEALEQIFAEYQQDGRVVVEYDTKMYWGQKP